MNKQLPMSTLEKAIQIAAMAHAGQLDMAGEKYVLHPIRVMLQVATEEEKITAMLHDVVEDSELTLENLKKEGFSDEILAAVDALTKRPGETRIEAAHRAAANHIARAVKLADNADNSDVSRIKNPTQKDLARLEEYKKVRAILQNRP